MAGSPSHLESALGFFETLYVADRERNRNRPVVRHKPLVRGLFHVAHVLRTRALACVGRHGRGQDGADIGPAIEGLVHRTPLGDLQQALSLVGVQRPGQRQRLLEIAEACPVHKLLTRGATVATLLSETL